MFRNKILPFYVAILPIGSFKSDYLGRICDLCHEMKQKVKLMKLDRGFYPGEVKIKSKSIIPIIRLFYFMISMLLLFMWNLCAKEEYSFKRFVINLEQVLKNVEVSRAD